MNRECMHLSVRCSVSELSRGNTACLKREPRKCIDADADFNTVSENLRLQGCAKKLVPGCEKSSAHLHPAQSGHARLVLSKIVTFLRTTLYNVLLLHWQGKAICNQRANH